MGAPVNIEAIEDAMKARIIAASTSGELGYRLGSVATYEGEFDDLDSLALTVRTFPAVWVVLADMGKPEAKGADKWLAPCTFGVMVGARIATALAAYFATLEPGDPVYLSRIETAISGVLGVVDRVVSTPAANVDVDAIQWARLGAVSVELLP